MTLTFSGFYECSNGHLRRRAVGRTAPDGSFNGRVCVECGAPVARCWGLP